jgi:ubiquinone/menaquinone biosynthesis C-methylase UbiE
MRRLDTPELLDSDAGTPLEIERSLRDLRRINLLFGGQRTTRLLLEQVIANTAARHRGDLIQSGVPDKPIARDDRLTLLDVACGSGDNITSAQRSFEDRGIKLGVTSLDQSLAHLTSVSGERIVGDALALPFRDASFDVVHCSLFLHHLDPQQVARFAGEAARVARIAVVINDLRRSRLHLLLTYLALPLFSRITRYDSIASVRRAYTPIEVKTMLKDSGARVARIEVMSYYLYRVGAIAWIQGESTT